MFATVNTRPSSAPGSIFLRLARASPAPVLANILASSNQEEPQDRGAITREVAVEVFARVDRGESMLSAAR